MATHGEPARGGERAHHRTPRAGERPLVASTRFFPVLRTATQRFPHRARTCSRCSHDSIGAPSCDGGLAHSGWK
eukprot:2353102-Prymnesium_polylepis.1